MDVTSHSFEHSSGTTISLPTQYRPVAFYRRRCYVPLAVTTKLWHARGILYFGSSQLPQPFNSKRVKEKGETSLLGNLEN